ncbi:MAG: hypothetical protein HY748_03865 [Elusimicrobia bacterium]|nr:hypothetical protein [Elusimicrobiota bacterium]
MMRPRTGIAVAASVFLTPLAWNNRPFWRHVLSVPGGVGLESLAELGRHGLLPLLAAGLWALAAVGAGSRVLRLIGSGGEGFGDECLGEDGPLRLPVAFALGAGASGLAVFALGLAGLLRPAPLLGLSLLFCAWAVPGLARLRSRRVPGDSSWTLPPAGWALTGILALAAWHTLILALAPATEWDVLLYHLAIPKLYLRLGRIQEIPWLLYSHWPHLMETLYALPLALGDDGAAALMHGTISGVLAVSVYRAGRAELGGLAMGRQVPEGAGRSPLAGGGCVGLTAAALVAAQPAFLRVAGAAHGDGAFALFHFLGSWALWRWASASGPADGGSRRRGRRMLAIAGLLAGLAASTKLAAASLLAASAFVVWLAENRRGTRSPWKAAAFYALCGLGVVLPWYAKTLVGTGNPFWPVFSKALGGRWGAESFESLYLRSSQWPWPLEAGRLLRWGPQYLLAPLAGLWLLAAMRGARTPSFLKFLLMPLIVYLPLIARYEDAWRYLLPFYPALALVSAWAAEALARPRAVGDPLARRPAPGGWGWPRSCAAGLVGIGLLPALLATQNNELFAVAGARSRLEPGRDSREVYLERTLDHYRAFRKLARVLPSSARVLFVREARGYYFEGDYQWGDPLNQGLIPYARLSGPDALDLRLRELGVTHVLVNEVLARDPAAARSYDPRVMELIRGFLERRTRLVFQDGPIAVYAL